MNRILYIPTLIVALLLDIGDSSENLTQSLQVIETLQGEEGGGAPLNILGHSLGRSLQVRQKCPERRSFYITHGQ